MQYNNSKFGFGLKENMPVANSLYSQGSGDKDIPIPPTSHFIITEDGNQIVTEDGNKLITE